MRSLPLRILLLLFALTAPTFLRAQTATVTGHVQFPSGAAATNANVCFSLQNFKPNLPRIAATGIIVQQQNWCITPAADGSYSTSLVRNDFITPAGTYWRVDFMWNGLQQSSASYLVNQDPFNLDIVTPLSQIPIAGPAQIVSQSFICSNPVPIATWTCVHNLHDVDVTVQVYDTTGAIIWPDKTAVTDANTVTISFIASQAGTAIITHAAAIAIATNQPNAVLQNPTGSQTVAGQPFNITGQFNASGGGALSGGFSVNAASVTDSTLAPGNCVQTTTGGLLTTTNGPCGTGSGSVNTTGTPAAGNLAKFSGVSSITNADLTGDVTTSGGTATTLASVVAPGTNTKITFNGKGLVTSASQAQFSDIGGTITPSSQLPDSVAAATNTKITYSAKGLVTSSAQAQFSDIGGVAAVAQIPALPISDINPGLNGQCAITSGSASTWGSCAGTAGVQLLNVNTTTVNVNASTTSNQNLMSYTFAAGSLNAVGKTFRITTWGDWNAVNTTETANLGFSVGGQNAGNLNLGFTPGVSGTFLPWNYYDILCTVTFTGTSGSLLCGTSGDAQFNTGANNSVLTSTHTKNTLSVNLTVGLTVQFFVNFSTASASNIANQYYMTVEQLN